MCYRNKTREFLLDEKVVIWLKKLKTTIDFLVEGTSVTSDVSANVISVMFLQTRDSTNISLPVSYSCEAI
jgi:hypothetical protein